jgi:hypothetical protein
MNQPTHKQKTKKQRKKETKKADRRLTNQQTKTNKQKQTPCSWFLLEKLTRSQTVKKLLNVLWDLKVHYRVQKILPPVHTQINPVHDLIIS